ncbi:MAG: helix-turn-helix domain-containing protein [Oscillospiraceae bacterium]|nr:helix-turn-helix domain-containing protein [Oscillospiraceae bacterium]
MLGKILKELRAKHNITQEQLAAAIGVERSSIGKYEGNQSVMPSVDVLNAIADYFNVTTDYLLGRTRTYEQSPPQAFMVAEPSGDALTTFHRGEFKGVTQDEVDKLAIFAEGLKAGRQPNDSNKK